MVSGCTSIAQFCLLCQRYNISKESRDLHIHILYTLANTKNVQSWVELENAISFIYTKSFLISKIAACKLYQTLEEGTIDFMSESNKLLVYVAAAAACADGFC